MKITLTSFLVLMVLFSCRSPRKLSQDYVYFQNRMDSLGTARYEEPIIQSNDLLSIQVFSGGISQEQAALFNIPNSGSAGAAGASASAFGTAPAGAFSGYQVDGAGNVEIPILGAVKAAGLTRTQLAASISRKLESKGLVKDPLVLVKFNQFRVNVFGEVRVPGTKTFNTDRTTILDVLAAAGDLTDDGRRDSIQVLRELPTGRVSYVLDIRDASMFHSPAFQMHQNDIVYVSPRKNKLRNLNVNPNFQRNFSLIIAGLSLLTTLASLSIVIANNK